MFFCSDSDCILKVFHYQWKPFVPSHYFLANFLNLENNLVCGRFRNATNFAYITLKMTWFLLRLDYSLLDAPFNFAAKSVVFLYLCNTLHLPSLWQRKHFAMAEAQILIFAITSLRAVSEGMLTSEGRRAARRFMKLPLKSIWSSGYMCGTVKIYV